MLCAKGQVNMCKDNANEVRARLHDYAVELNYAMAQYPEVKPLSGETPYTHGLRLQSLDVSQYPKVLREAISQWLKNRGLESNCAER